MTTASRSTCPARRLQAPQTIYHSETAMVVAGPNWTQHAEFYFGDTDMASHASDTTPPTAVFQVLSAAATGTVPLMSVLYQSTQNHVELSAGKERFKRASNQGPGPLWHVEWAGITKPTTLVVEALATGCPFQGFLAPQAVTAPPHQPLFTIDQLQTAATTGEVFINGQYDLPGTSAMGGISSPDISTAWSPWLATPDSSPVPVARSFVQVSPQPHDASAWDWYEGFTGDFATLTPAADSASCACQDTSAPPCNSGSGSCGFWTSPTLDVGMYEVENPNNVSLFATGNLLGQFWDAFDDWAQDVTATLRFTAPMKANLDADSGASSCTSLGR